MSLTGRCLSLALTPRVAPVGRPREEAARVYDRIAPFYDVLEGRFKRRARALGLGLLAARPGERIVEVGPGTGEALAALAQAVGPDGHVAAVEVSRRMAARATRRLRKLGVEGRVALIVADAVEHELPPSSFDGAFLSFVLELFDEPDIRHLLRSLRDALAPAGRLVVVSLAA